MLSHKKRPESTHPGRIKQPPKKEGPVDVSIAKRGGPGLADQSHPDPHKTHSPKPKVQVVCKW